MAKRTRKPPATFRTRITRRIAKERTQKEKLKALSQQRRQAERELSRLQRQITKEEKRLKKLKKRRATEKLKSARRRAASHRRDLKTLSNIRSIVKTVKRARGGRKQRKADIGTEDRTAQGQKFGIKKRYRFNHFNHQANYNAIGTWLGILKKESRIGIKGFYISAQIEGKLKHPGEAPIQGSPTINNKTGKVEKEHSQNKFEWFNLLQLAGFGSGINVDVMLIDKSAGQMVDSSDWKTWRDSGLPQIRTIVISTSEVNL